MDGSLALRNAVASAMALVLAVTIGSGERATTVSVGPHNIIMVDGKSTFPIGFIKGPPAGSKTPSGDDAYKELKRNGMVFLWAGVFHNETWDAEAEAKLDRDMRLSANAGLLTAISIYPLEALGPNDQQHADELRRVVRKYAQSPALGFWKAKDEPAWGKTPADDVLRYSDIVRQLDPNHPIWLIHAPRGTVASLQAYNPGADILDTDIYPISYPPGTHSLDTNKDISMVGDYAKKLQQVSEGKKPFFMTLQICWSGVANPGRTLRFPTFAEERYMVYQAIIDGARGLVFFGGDVNKCMDARDKELGWNWRFYDQVLKPVLNELNPKSPVYPALVAANSSLPVKLNKTEDIEYQVRESGGYLYILAAKREGETVQVGFSGLPPGIQTGEVLYEEPRKITVSSGQFSDWFAPHDVHVYRFKLP